MKSCMFAAMVGLFLLTACGPARTLIVTDYVPAKNIRTPDQSVIMDQASLGNPVAQYQAGQIYHDGIGVTRSHKMALRLWKDSANAGYAPAQYALGMLYFGGSGIKTDFVEGCRWLAAAASQGMPAAISAWNRHCAD